MLDGGYYHVYHSLKEMGHDVYLYDTVNPDNKDFSQIVETFKPDVIWACLTGDFNIAPYEPLREIRKETESGRTRTFNWFCDDTWRFDTFSSKVCNYFLCCSTPEPSFIDKYKESGYNNIVLGNWHINETFLKRRDFDEKDVDVSFIGNLTPQRKSFFHNSSIDIKNYFNLSSDEFFNAHARTKIGINLSRNDNDPFKGTQMKQRVFEIAASNGLVVTEYHNGIEEFFDIDKEIITFKTQDEFEKKVNFLLKNDKIAKKIANNGYNRFAKEHESKIRIQKILKTIVEF